MSPERIRSWLNRVPKAAAQLLLLYEAVGQKEVVCAWGKDELAGNGGAAEMICDAAQEHCNDLAGPARYLLQWVSSESNKLSSKLIRAKPDHDEDEDGGPLAAGKLEDPTIAGVVGQVLRHQEAMARMYVGSMSGILSNMQQMLTLQQEQIRNQAQRARAAERANEAGDTDQESIARAEAMVKFTEAITQHVIPLIAQRMNPH